MRNQGIEYAARGQMRFCDLGESPALQPAEILLRTRYSGITNGTERHALLAEHFWSAFSGRHGYQHVAEVEAVGEEVMEFHPSDCVFYSDYVGHRARNVVNVGQGLIRTAPLISHVVPIDQAPAIYEILRDRPAELLGVIFDWNV